MKYKFYFYNGIPTAERRSAEFADEGLVIEAHNMDSDDAAMLYAGDFISDLNEDQMEFETAIEAEDYLNDIDTSAGFAFCIAIQKNDEFVYGDSDLVDYFMRKEADDDAVTEAIVSEAAQKPEQIELFYEDLEIIIYGEQRDADDWDEYEYTVDWEYSVDKADLYTYIWENCLEDDEFPEGAADDFDPNNAEDWAKFEAWLDDNFDTIFEKYKTDILENWEDAAREDAEEKYDPRDYIDWDCMPGGHDDY